MADAVERDGWPALPPWLLELLQPGAKAQTDASPAPGPAPAPADQRALAEAIYGAGGPKHG